MGNNKALPFINAGRDVFAVLPLSQRHDVQERYSGRAFGNRILFLGDGPIFPAGLPRFWEIHHNKKATCSWTYNKSTTITMAKRGRAAG